jgi:hypothetical protein
MAISKPARTFQDLLVWQRAHQFVLGIYALTVALQSRYLRISRRVFAVAEGLTKLDS